MSGSGDRQDVEWWPVEVRHAAAALIARAERAEADCAMHLRAREHLSGLVAKKNERAERAEAEVERLREALEGLAAWIAAALTLPDRDE